MYLGDVGDVRTCACHYTHLIRQLLLQVVSTHRALELLSLALEMSCTYFQPLLFSSIYFPLFLYFTISPTTLVNKVCQSSVRFELVMLSMHYLEYFWVEFRRDCIDFVVNSWLMPFSGSEDGEPAETSALNKTSYHLVFGLTRKPNNVWYMFFLFSLATWNYTFFTNARQFW